MLAMMKSGVDSAIFKEMAAEGVGWTFPCFVYFFFCWKEGFFQFQVPNDQALGATTARLLKASSTIGGGGDGEKMVKSQPQELESMEEAEEEEEDENKAGVEEEEEE